MRGAGISTSYNTRVTEDLGLLDSLDELIIDSPTTSPQRPARRPRTPLARNTIGSRYTMSPPRPNTAVASRYGVRSPRYQPGLTSHFSSTATPPRSHNVLET